MKVLYIEDRKITVRGLRTIVQEFTINNGCYPERIEMSKDAFDRYCDLFMTKDFQRIHFRDIPIVRVGVVDFYSSNCQSLCCIKDVCGC